MSQTISIRELADMIDPALESTMLHDWIEQHPIDPLEIYGDHDAVYRAFRAETFGINEDEDKATRPHPSSQSSQRTD